jgi:flagellar biosynthetic protein FliQ
MTTEYAIDVIQNMMTTATMVVAPILIVATVVGLIISVLQTVTSIQEQTLTFFPKVLAVSGVLIAILPWILRTIIDFTYGMITQMSQMTN